jgi:hypothetical protein
MNSLAELGTSELAAKRNRQDRTSTDSITKDLHGRKLVNGKEDLAKTMDSHFE